jgi:microsomal dipeptidase-like Zn-dependent dipeptidase
VLAGAVRSAAATSKTPGDFITVEGHRDIWEFNDRFALCDRKQHSPLRDFILPRMIEGNLSVCIMPAGGDSLAERHGLEKLFEGSMRVLDMLLFEMEKCAGKATIIRNKSDVPTRPNKGQVQFFLDIEGGASIQIDHEPEYHADRRLALLRQFYRLGVRGMQLTHNGRNMLGDGIGEGKMAGRLSRFGVGSSKK